MDLELVPTHTISSPTKATTVFVTWGPDFRSQEAMRTTGTYHIKGPGQSWIHTFTRPGTYTYFCTIHPWMEGVVTVKGKAQNTPNYPVYASAMVHFYP